MEEDLAPATHSQEQEQEQEEEPLELVTRRQEPGKMEPPEHSAQTIVAYSIAVIISCVCWKVVFMRESRSILH